MTIRRAVKMLILFVTSAALAVEDRITAQVPAAQDGCAPQTLGPAVVDVPSIAVQRVHAVRVLEPSPAEDSRTLAIYEVLAGPTRLIET